MCGEVKSLVSYVQIQNTINYKYQCYYYNICLDFFPKHSLYYIENELFFITYGILAVRTYLIFSNYT